MTQLAVVQPSASGTGSSGYVPLVGDLASSASDQAVAVVYLISVAERGSGGLSRVDWSRANARTGPFTLVREGTASDQALTTADRVLLLRRWFSLSIAEAARILQVQRPTIYSWQDGNVPASPKNLARLHALFDLARVWRAISADPVGKYRKEPLGSGGRTLVDLLSADEIPRAQVIEALTRIVGAVDRTRGKRPASGAELAQRFGFKPLSEGEFVENVTGESSPIAEKTGGS